MGHKLTLNCSALLAVSLSITGFPAFAAVPFSEAERAHVEAIENAILPDVLTDGRPVHTSTLAERMKADNVPGLSIAVFHNGQIVWARGYGVADTAGKAVTPDTLFLAGSISKPVTAMAVLNLVQAGRLNLDTDVNQYLKSWKVPANSYTEHMPVTLRELLTHTAGMTVHGFWGYAQGEPVPTLVQILDGKKPANSPPIRVDITPGTVWRYSGGGYVVMQQLLEDVTGRPFPEIARSAVLVPAGMTKSTFVQPLPVSRAAEAAAPFDEKGVPIKGGAYTYPEIAPAGLWTTPSDLARYAIEMQRALAGQSHMIGKSLALEMVKPGGLGGWGLGWQVTGGEHPHFEHGGADVGFISNLVAYNRGDGVAIMTNGYGGGPLGQEVLRTVAHEYGWPDYGPVDRKTVTVPAVFRDRYVGKYRLGRYNVLSITRDGEKLFAQRGTEPPQELLPASETDWFYANSNVHVLFEPSSNDRAAKAVLRLPQFDMQGARVSDIDAKRSADELSDRVKAQKQDPRSEGAVRKMIDGWTRGQPDYDYMSPALAAAVRQQLPETTSDMKVAGPVRDILFKGVGPGGADIYNVSFEDGRVFEMRATVGAGDIVESFNFRPLPDKK